MDSYPPLLFVDKAYRHKGVVFAALKATLEEIELLGGGTVQSSPEDLEGRKVSTFLYNATLAMLEQEGFDRTLQLGKNNWLVTKKVRARRSPNGTTRPLGGAGVAPRLSRRILVGFIDPAPADMNSSNPDPSDPHTPPNEENPSGFFGGPWMPAIAAGFVLLVVVATGVWGGRDSRSATGESLPTPATTTEPVPTTLLAPPVASEPVAPAAGATTLAAPLAKGISSDDVKLVQQRLTDLGFQPGPVDGFFGTATQQAVWAYKKLVGVVGWEEFAERDDQTVVTDELWQQMQDPSVQIRPRRPGAGTRIEIYLPLQVLAVFEDNQPIFVAHISSGELNPDGTPATFCEEATYDTDEYGNPYPEPVTKQVCAESKSPGGIFTLRRYYEGKRISPLGGMKNPWYFNYGIAIHGAENVPTRPASHGCIRLSNSLADVFPTIVSKGDVVHVWGHDGKDPEQYTERQTLPSFNRPDPNASTTTTSTTVPPSSTTLPVLQQPTPTAAPTTTVAPTTTTAPTTTVPPTTTTAPPNL